jgi:hypothetical protein
MHMLENAIKIERLALVARQLIERKPADDLELEKALREALPRAFRLVQLTKEFLDKKDEESQG